MHQLEVACTFGGPAAKAQAPQSGTRKGPYTRARFALPGHNTGPQKAPTPVRALAFLGTTPGLFLVKELSDCTVLSRD